MDLNLVSNLVRWASMAKYKVGEKRLSDIIELYAQSRNAPPGLSKALIHIASIVDDQPPETGQTAQETMDLIAHLHGILTASLPVPPVPLIQGQISFATGNDLGNVLARAQQTLNRLADINDMNRVTLTENVRRHFRVPPACPMSEMNAAIN